jgi:hypothetical protein
MGHQSDWLTLDRPRETPWKDCLVIDPNRPSPTHGTTSFGIATLDVQQHEIDLSRSSSSARRPRKPDGLIVGLRGQLRTVMIGSVIDRAVLVAGAYWILYRRPAAGTSQGRSYGPAKALRHV